MTVTIADAVNTVRKIGASLDARVEAGADKEDVTINSPELDPTVYSEIPANEKGLDQFTEAVLKAQLGLKKNFDETRTHEAFRTVIGDIARNAGVEYDAAAKAFITWKDGFVAEQLKSQGEAKVKGQIDLVTGKLPLPKETLKLLEASAPGSAAGVVAQTITLLQQTTKDFQPIENLGTLVIEELKK